MSDISGVIQLGALADALAIRLRCHDSGGELSVVEMTLDAGAAGPPLHMHPTHGEGFYVLAGTPTFQVGDRVVSGDPGTRRLGRARRALPATGRRTRTARRASRLAALTRLARSERA